MTVKPKILHDNPLLLSLLHPIYGFAFLLFLLDKALDQPLSLVNWDRHAVLFAHVHVILEEEEFFHEVSP